MNIVKDLPYYLLGLVFLVFGMNGFLNFMPLPTPEGDAATFFGVMSSTGYMTVVKALEVICGILLLMPKTRSLGLVLLMPIVVNILLFELLISKQPGLGVLLFVINAIGLYLNRDKYAGMLPS